MYSSFELNVGVMF